MLKNSHSELKCPSFCSSLAWSSFSLEAWNEKKWRPCGQLLFLFFVLHRFFFYLLSTPRGCLFLFLGWGMGNEWREIRSSFFNMGSSGFFRDFHREISNCSFFGVCKFSPSFSICLEARPPRAPGGLASLPPSLHLIPENTYTPFRMCPRLFGKLIKTLLAPWGF